jgi:hypothetical protein
MCCAVVRSCFFNRDLDLMSVPTLFVIPFNDVAVRLTIAKYAFGADSKRDVFKVVRCLVFWRGAVGVAHVSGNRPPTLALVGLGCDRACRVSEDL